MGAALGGTKSLSVSPARCPVFQVLDELFERNGHPNYIRESWKSWRAANGLVFAGPARRIHSSGDGLENHPVVPHSRSGPSKCCIHKRSLGPRVDSLLFQIPALVQFIVTCVANSSLIDGVRSAASGSPGLIDQNLRDSITARLWHIPDILNGVDVTLGKSVDRFRTGVYTSTRMDKALDWGVHVKALRVGGTAAVVEFTVSRNDIARLDGLFFVRGDTLAADYWSFVQYCRTIGGDHNRAQTPWYDLVAGPVTGSWKRQTVILNGDQISFHTKAGAFVLDASRKTQVI